MTAAAITATRASAILVGNKLEPGAGTQDNTPQAAAAVAAIAADRLSQPIKSRSPLETAREAIAQAENLGPGQSRR